MEMRSFVPIATPGEGDAPACFIKRTDSLANPARLLSGLVLSMFASIPPGQIGYYVVLGSMGSHKIPLCVLLAADTSPPPACRLPPVRNITTKKTLPGT